MVALVQNVVLVALGVLAFAVEVFALVDAARQRGDAFVAQGKQTKLRWLIILGIAAAIGFLALPPPIGAGLTSNLGLLGVAAFVAAGVYLADVRPKVRQSRGGPRSGPYGPW